MGTTENPTITLYLFGSMKGESTLVRLPNGRWGMVDCYIPDLKHPDRNFLYRFLKSNHINSLEFLCMTHPHEDHFSGMSTILKELTVKYFFSPPAMTGPRLFQIVKSIAVDARKVEDKRLESASNELIDIYEILKSKKKHRRGDPPFIPQDGTTRKILYPAEHSPNEPIRITAIAPTTRQVQDYEEKLAVCFDNDQTLVSPFKYRRHNEISLAFVLEFGKTRIIFGGDVEKKSWRLAMSQLSHDTFNCHLVKISHHGSKTGYCRDLWKAFSKNGKPLAFLTSYDEYDLPRDVEVAYFKQFTSKLVTPYRKKGIGVVPAAIDKSLLSRKLVASELNARSINEKYFGYCSFTLDANGNCVSEAHTDYAELL